MKTKLVGVLALLAGSTLFAAPRVVIGLGVGVPAYGYGYVAPAPVVVAPPAYPAGVWVNGYYGPRHEWHRGYWGPRPVYRGYRR